LNYQFDINSAALCRLAFIVNLTDPGVPASSKIAVAHGGTPAGTKAPLNSTVNGIVTVAAPAGWVKHKNTPDSKSTKRNFVRTLYLLFSLSQL
jgi:hypothetical protein